MTDIFLLRVIPYFILILIADLILFIRKVVFLYGITPAFLLGGICFLLILSTSVLLYIGHHAGRTIFLVIADLYCGIVLPFSGITVLSGSGGMIQYLRIALCALLMLYVFLLSSPRMKDYYY
ncbi:MAG: hypothetical protein ACOCWH_00835 [Spirochaetota bacterium]